MRWFPEAPFDDCQTKCYVLMALNNELEVYPLLLISDKLVIVSS